MFIGFFLSRASAQHAVRLGGTFVGLVILFTALNAAIRAVHFTFAVSRDVPVLPAFEWFYEFSYSTDHPSNT